MCPWIVTSFNMQTPPRLVQFRQLLTDGAPTSPQPTALGIDSSHAPCSFLSLIGRTWSQKAKGCRVSDLPHYLQETQGLLLERITVSLLLSFGLCRRPQPRTYC